MNDNTNVLSASRDKIKGRNYDNGPIRERITNTP